MAKRDRPLTSIGGLGEGQYHGPETQRHITRGLRLGAPAAPLDPTGPRLLASVEGEGKVDRGQTSDRQGRRRFGVPGTFSGIAETERRR